MTVMSSDATTPAVLREILEHKRGEIEERRRKYGVAELKEWAGEQGAARGFAHSLKDCVRRQKPAVIAEIKRASPSKGVLREEFDPLALAGACTTAGAVCLSVLTDHKYFMGSGAVLDLIRKHCPLPVLRKDFIIDEYQVYESRAFGADCLLLIAAALEAQQMADLFHLARDHGMDVLVEVHDEDELARALALGDAAELIGVNNRNLHTFEVSLDATLRLADAIPDGKIVISESGIRRRGDVNRLRDAAVYAYLVGEALMVADDPGAELKALFFD